MQTFPRSEHAYNHIEISKSRILANTKLLQNMHSGMAVAPVLKSNAYGHGIDVVGALLDTQNFPFFCVNSLFEANMLREAGVKTDILIMGYVSEEDLKKKDYDFCFAIYDLEQAKILSKLQTNPRVHLNIETGLHRDGIVILEDTSSLTALQALSNLQIEGMMSHLACSNDPACPTTTSQLANFGKAKKILQEEGITPKWFHLGGSLALLNELAKDCNVVRCGKAFFGIALNSSYQATSAQTTINEKTEDFRPVLSLHSQVVQVKKVRKGEHIGYADACIADKDMTIGILPIGYYDGIDRRLSNKGVVKVAGVFCRMLGMVAMNVTTIDLTEVKNPHISQEVLVYSDNLEDENTLDKAAKLAGTLPQDLLLHLALSLKRGLTD